MTRRRILAISSGGGHWVQLQRLSPAFADHTIYYATVHKSDLEKLPCAGSFLIPDATRWNRLGLVLMALRIFWILLRVRPDVIISTGAAPGYLGMRIGKWLGARTMWLDSIANVEELSLSGQRIGRYADLWLTQWPHLASLGGPQFRGAVL